MSASSCAEDLRLPPLRDDLQLMEGPPDTQGVPSWTVFDPIRNRYFRIGWMAFQLLSRWSIGRASALLQRVHDETTCRVERSDVAELLHFLLANNLTREPAMGKVDAYLAQVNALRTRWGSWALHHYLFFRIPLVRPERFLRRTLPYVEPLFGRRMQQLVAGLGLVGLYLASRQWEAFHATFLHFFTWQGLLYFALAQAGVKVLHEFGHAYAATRYGCRVPTMGVAFLVMFPVLYTDTTDAWRLTSRHQRLVIGAAGILTELGLAAIATFAWSFLPEGPARSAAFVVATTSWVLTLMVNLNPCMRFDGYYLLSDWWGVENLQSRGFALARWRLREWLFDYGDEAPVSVAGPLHRRLVLYAWATWIYRFFLFLGIALLVYHFFFKALGLVLFAVELAWFLGLPILGELRVWWTRRSEAWHGRHAPWLAGGLALMLLLVAVPWHTRVSLPAVYESRDHAWVFAPDPGRVVEVHARRGQAVRAGDVLLVLDSPRLRHELRLAEQQSAWLGIRARRQAASPEDRADLRVVLQQLEETSSRLAALRERLEQLVIRAPLDGVVTDLAEALHEHRWIPPTLPLAHVADPRSPQIRALAPEAELGRLEAGRTARFFPDEPDRDPVRATLQDIGRADLPAFDVPYLASVYGGPIAVRPDPQRKDGKHVFVPEGSVYRVRLRPADGALVPDRAVRGVAHVSARPRSLAGRAWDAAAAVVIRESGF